MDTLETYKYVWFGLYLHNMSEGEHRENIQLIAGRLWVSLIFLILSFSAENLLPLHHVPAWHGLFHSLAWRKKNRTLPSVDQWVDFYEKSKPGWHNFQCTFCSYREMNRELHLCRTCRWAAFRWRSGERLYLKWLGSHTQSLLCRSMLVHLFVFSWTFYTGFQWMLLKLVTKLFSLIINM